MKKIVLCIFIIVMVSSIIECKSSSFIVATNASYKTSDTISLDEYLYLKKSPRDMKKLKLNLNGDVVYKNKIILTTKGVPLNENTAYTNTEFKIYFMARGIKPRKNCNPNDVVENGSLGCFIDNPN